METFDVIVVGVGSMGAAACYHLAQRNVSVLGLERYSLGHAHGSHLGQSRLIRKAYFEHPDYVPLLIRAYELWEELEERTDTKLFYQTGLLYHGRVDQDLIAGCLRSANLYQIPFYELSRQDVEKEYPHFTLPETYHSFLEPDAGFLRPEKSIQVMGDYATSLGARIQVDEWMTDFVRNENGWAVHTNRNVYSCEKLIITAGAWTSNILPQIGVPLRVTRQVLGWLNQNSGPDTSLDEFPCWILADDQYGGSFYGFPALPIHPFGSPEGLKMAHHHPGFEILPEDKDQAIRTEEIKVMTYGLEKYLGGIKGSWSSFQNCMYTMTPDEHFLIDQVPNCNNVWMAGGFSGHGFKFAPVIGEILADLAVDGHTRLPVEFLAASRFQSPGE